MSIPVEPNTKANVRTHYYFDPNHLGREVSEDLKKVYVWQLPVRIFHWVNALAIIILMITGIFISKPFVGAVIQEEAYYNFLMGWVRYIHFFTAFVFTINLLVRLYWVFVGNQFARSNPLKKEFWVCTLETTKDYLFLKNKKRHRIGHNALAELSYWIFIGAGSIIMMFTGYYLLFEPSPETFFGKFFSFVPYIFGGSSFAVRSWHHIVSWGFILFMLVHVYMAIREDWLSKNGTLSSIFTGYKSEYFAKKQANSSNDGEKSE